MRIELAISGMPKTFNEPLFVGKPNIGNRERLGKLFEEILDSRWLTNNGAQVQEFEKRLSEFLGVKHCIATCNATIALEIAIKALGLKGKVIVPSFTFVATVHALQWQGIEPTFCDVDPNTHNIDPHQVERLITPQTTGIMGVHLWGRGCDASALRDIASANDLSLLFDAAHAFGCSHRGQMIGSLGDAEVFSFHATKFLNTFEGGAIATNSDELAGRIRLMKNFGFAGFDNVIYIGTNGKMSEISAAMGLVSLESMQDFVAVNKRNYHAYREGLQGVPGLAVLEYSAEEHNNYQYIVVEVDPKTSRISRDDLVEVLHAENIIARRYFYPGCHRMEPYRTMGSALWPVPLRKTERLSEAVMILPTGTAVDVGDIRKICGVVRHAIEHGPEVTALLAGLRD